jgi:hypothetical protein
MSVGKRLGKNTMKTAKQVLIVIGISEVFGGIVNLIHPRRIAWVGDWKRHVETQVVEEGVALVQLPDVIEI